MAALSSHEHLWTKVVPGVDESLCAQGATLCATPVQPDPLLRFRYFHLARDAHWLDHEARVHGSSHSLPRALPVGKPLADSDHVPSSMFPSLICLARV